MPRHTDSPLAPAPNELPRNVAAAYPEMQAFQGRRREGTSVYTVWTAWETPTRGSRYEANGLNESRLRGAFLKVKHGTFNIMMGSLH